MSRTWLDRAVILLLAILWCCTVYRAATQSISVDEAFTYDRFVSQPFVDMMNGRYEANNHVLYTMLAQLSVDQLGVSELALRVPALIGGLLFFTALFLLCRLLFPARWVYFLAIALISLNPFFLDYLSIARGYGLALAFYLTALYFVARVLMQNDGARWKLFLGGISLGLCVSANLTFLFPVLALILVASFLVFRLLRRPLLIGLLTVPFLAIAALINGVPLSHAGPNNFDFGSTSLQVTLDGFLAMSFHRDRSPYILFGRQFSHVAAPITVLLLVAVLVLVCYVLWRRSPDRAYDVPMVLTGGIFISTVAGLLAAHFLLSTLYPYRRTGIYLVLLFVLSCGAALQYFDRSRLRWASRGLAFAASVPILFLFLTQTNFRMYGEWPFDTNYRTLIDRIVRLHAANPKAQVKIGLNPLYRFQLYFYRTTLGLDWIAPMDFESQDSERDYYLLRPEDRGLIERRNLEVVYRDPESYAILAVPPGKS